MVGSDKLESVISRLVGDHCTSAGWSGDETPTILTANDYCDLC